MTDVSLVAARAAGADAGQRLQPDRARLPEPVVQAFGAFERGQYEGPGRPRDVVDAVAFDHLMKRLEEGRHPVLSLDVFDTLLLRNDKCERRRFWEIAGRWESSAAEAGHRVDVLDLYLARLRAAQISYSCGPIVASTQEGRLDSLIGITLSLVGLPESLVSAFMKAELAYEAENLAPNPVLVALAEKHRGVGGRVMLLSDMYVPGEKIHQLLHGFGIGAISEHIYSSADSTVNKRSGTMFAPAARAIGASPEEILHLGDNYIADYAMPRQRGWAAQHLPVPLVEERAREQDLRDFSAMITELET